MKRVMVFLVAAAVLCLMVLGCGQDGGSTAEPVTAGFTCAVSVDYAGMALKGQISRTADGRLLTTFSEPASLAGVAISWDGETMAMELGGVTVPVDAAKVPQGALVKSLLTVLTAAPTEGELTEEGYVLEGETDEKTYKIVCAPDTGLIRSLSVPEENLTVMFENTALLTEKTA